MSRRAPRLGHHLERVVVAAHAIGAAGYELELVDHVEDTRHPGILGFAGGICDRDRRVVKARRAVTIERLAEVLEHELRHALGEDHGPDWPGFTTTATGYEYRA